MQPSHSRWERLPASEPGTAARLMKGMSTLRLTSDESDSENQPPDHGSESHDALTVTATANGDGDNDHDHDNQPLPNDENAQPPTVFSTVPPAFSRRFAIHDTYYESPPYSNMGVPGPDGDVHDLGSNGLLSIADPKHPEFVGPDVLAELPPECKEALIEDAAREWEWKTQWQSETAQGSRTIPLKSYAWFP